MGWPAFLALDVLSFLVGAWPLWLALLVSQVIFLLMGLEQHRWLPTGLFVFGLAWCVMWPIIAQLRDGAS